MACYPPPFANAVLAEASRIAPRRRTTSDGICADWRHYQTGGDHVPDARGIPHAVDISHSVPGAPFWLPGYDQFDAMAWARVIGARMVAGLERRVKYLVANFGGPDMILNLSVSPAWRQNGPYQTEHRSHLHVSFWPSAEQSTAPFFRAFAAPPVPPPEVDMPLNDEDKAWIKATIYAAIGGKDMNPPKPDATVVQVVKTYTK